MTTETELAREWFDKLRPTMGELRHQFMQKQNANLLTNGQVIRLHERMSVLPPLRVGGHLREHVHRHRGRTFHLPPGAIAFDVAELVAEQCVAQLENIWAAADGRVVCRFGTCPQGEIFVRWEEERDPLDQWCLFGARQVGGIAAGIVALFS